MSGWQVLREKYAEAPPSGERRTGAMQRALEARSIMIAPWPGGDDREPDRAIEVEREIELIQEIIGSARNLRGELNMPPSEKIELYLETPDERRAALLDRHREMIETLASVDTLHIGEQHGEGGHWASAMVHDISVVIPISEELRAQEIERLTKEIKRAEADEQRLRKKLENENFVSKAPKEVVDREREKHERAATELEGLRKRLERLQ